MTMGPFNHKKNQKFCIKKWKYRLELALFLSNEQSEILHRELGIAFPFLLSSLSLSSLGTKGKVFLLKLFVLQQFSLRISLLNYDKHYLHLLKGF